MPEFAPGQEHHLGFELEVLEARASHGSRVEQVRPRTAGGQAAVGDLPGCRVLVGLPAVQALAVEEADPIARGALQQRGAGHRA